MGILNPNNFLKLPPSMVGDFGCLPITGFQIKLSISTALKRGMSYHPCPKWSDTDIETIVIKTNF